MLSSSRWSKELGICPRRTGNQSLFMWISTSSFSFWFFFTLFKFWPLFLFNRPEKVVDALRYFFLNYTWINENVKIDAMQVIWFNCLIICFKVRMLNSYEKYMKKFSAVSSQNSSFTHFKFPADNGTNFKDKPYRSPKKKKQLSIILNVNTYTQLSFLQGVWITINFHIFVWSSHV